MMTSVTELFFAGMASQEWSQWFEKKGKARTGNAK